MADNPRPVRPPLTPAERSARRVRRLKAFQVKLEVAMRADVEAVRRIIHGSSQPTDTKKAT